MFGTPETVIIGFDYLNATELEEMQRNLDLLYSTRAGTCPGDRNFGLEQTFESCPTNVYTQAEDGNLTPKIIIGPKDPEDTEDADTEESEE